MEIRIQAVAADLFAVEIAVGCAADQRRLRGRGRAAHNGKHLPREHHAHAAREIALDPVLMIVVIAVEPTLVLTRDPLRLADVCAQALGHGLKRVRQREGVKAALAAAHAVCAEVQEVRQAVFFF